MSYVLLTLMNGGQRLARTWVEVSEGDTMEIYQQMDAYEAAEHLRVSEPVDEPPAMTDSITEIAMLEEWMTRNLSRVRLAVEMGDSHEGEEHPDGEAERDAAR